MRFNPAAKLLFWLAFLLACSLLDGLPLVLVCLVLLGVSGLHASSHLRRLLRRSFWLILTMVLVLLLMTPGVPLSFLPCVSHEGLQLAVQHGARLLLVLSSLALVFRYLTHAEWVAGLYALLSPFNRLGVPEKILPAQRLAVRVMLTLAFVEEKSAALTPPGEAVSEAKMLTQAAMKSPPLSPSALARFPLPRMVWRLPDWLLLSGAMLLIASMAIA
jgi:energy-coupling factor transporter transmembrane protein EcfT